MDSSERVAQVLAHRDAEVVGWLVEANEGLTRAVLPQVAQRVVDTDGTDSGAVDALGALLRAVEQVDSVRLTVEQDSDFRAFVEAAAADEQRGGAA